MAWFGRDLKYHLVPTPCFGQGYQPLDQTVQELIKPGFELLYGWGIHNFSGQPVPVHHQSHTAKNFFLTFNLKHTSFSLNLFPLIVVVGVLRGYGMYRTGFSLSIVRQCYCADLDAEKTRKEERCERMRKRPNKAQCYLVRTNQGGTWQHGCLGKNIYKLLLISIKCAIFICIILVCMPAGAGLRSTLPRG